MYNPIEVVSEIRKKLIEEMADLEKRYDVDDWSNSLEPGRMEGEEAYEMGRYETMKGINDIITKK